MYIFNKLIEMFAKYSIYSVVGLCALVLFPSTKSDCNEFVCGSVVSKCLLTQSCQCKLTDCFCCKDCLNCLGGLYTECCSCVEMCPKHNDTLSALAPKSQIGDFEGVPELFDTLTAEEDELQWTTIRFPMRNSLAHHSKQLSVSFPFDDDIDQYVFTNKKLQNTFNCTVIYLNTCTTNKKCSQYCESMGSRSYRWFHDGCCECVGANCFNYGINESRCSACPDDADGDEDMEDDEDDDDADYAGENEDDSSWDYGEDEINYN